MRPFRFPDVSISSFPFTDLIPTSQEFSADQTEPEDLNKIPDQYEEVFNADFGGKSARNTIWTPKALLFRTGKIISERKLQDDDSNYEKDGRLRQHRIFKIEVVEKKIGTEGKKQTTASPETKSNTRPNNSFKPSENDAVALSPERIKALASGGGFGSTPTTTTPTPTSTSTPNSKAVPLNSPPIAPPSLAYLKSCLPHPDAYYMPSLGVWKVIARGGSGTFLSEEGEQRMESDAVTEQLFKKYPGFDMESNEMLGGNGVEEGSMLNVPLWGGEEDMKVEERFIGTIKDFKELNIGESQASESDKSETNLKIDDQFERYLWSHDELPKPPSFEQFQNFKVFKSLSNCLTKAASNAKTPDLNPFTNLYVSSEATDTEGSSTSPSVLSSIVPIYLLEEFRSARNDFPLLSDLSTSSTSSERFAKPLSTLLGIIGRASLGDTRVLPFNKALNSKMGADKFTFRILKSLGFSHGVLEDGRKCIVPPDIKINQNDPKELRAEKEIWRERLIRGWYEMSCWYISFFGDKDLSEVGNFKVNTKEVGLINGKGKDEIADLLGFRNGDPNQSMTSREKSKNSQPLLVTQEQYDILGCFWDASDRLLVNAYKINRLANPNKTRLLFSALWIVTSNRSQESDLGVLLTSEASRGLYTNFQLQKAYKFLTLGRSDGVGYLNSQLANNFQLQMFGNQRELELEKRNRNYEYLRQVSEIRGNPSQLEHFLRQRELLEISFRSQLGWGQEGSLQTTDYANMDLDQVFDVNISLEDAYKTLSIEYPLGIDDETLITIYEMAIADNPSLTAKCKNSLRIIAENSGSKMLEGFVKTGKKEENGFEAFEFGEGKKPAGLNNIGNTCFLNSVLQYFFVVNEIRTRVIEAKELWEAESLSLTTESIVEDPERQAGDRNGKGKERRVGGRLVTEREVLRSKKCEFKSRALAFFTLLRSKLLKHQVHLLRFLPPYFRSRGTARTALQCHDNLPLSRCDPRERASLLGSRLFKS